MKKILLIILFIFGITNADDCKEYKRKAIKYEQLGISTKDIDMGAQYLKMSIKHKKEAMNHCFYSAFDKEKIYRDIKEMQELVKNMKRKLLDEKQHDIDVAKERSTIHINHL